MAEKPETPDDEPVPRIPRTVGFKISTATIVRLVLTGTMLAMILVARRPCADSVSEFVTNFDEKGSGAAQMPKPGTVDVPSSVGSAGDYEPLRSDMTEDEIKAAIERAKAKSRGSAANAPATNLGSGMGSGSAGSAGSGSAGSGSAGSGSAKSGSGSSVPVGSGSTR